MKRLHDRSEALAALCLLLSACTTGVPVPAPARPRFDLSSGRSACVVIQPTDTVTKSEEFFPRARRLQSSKELASLLTLGEHGSPTRLGLVVQGTPDRLSHLSPFETSFSSFDGGFAFGELLPVPTQLSWAPHISPGPMRFIFVGYFSGQRVSALEYFRARGTEPPAPESERELASWQDRYPEFCVESLCWLPPELDRIGDSARRTELAAQAARQAAELEASKVRRCESRWMH